MKRDIELLKLYFSKRSSALAAHILLEEIAVPYSVEEISIPKGEHQTLKFLQLNPKGRVPVLQTPDGVVTENPAILEYIAASNPEANLMPQGIFAQAQARSLCGYICATAHVAFAHKQRGARWADDPQTIQSMQVLVPKNLADCAEFIETHWLQGPWAMGANYSFCDPYLFLMGRWMDANDVSLEPYPKIARHQAAMRDRPATQRALAVHELS